MKFVKEVLMTENDFRDVLSSAHMFLSSQQIFLIE